MLNRLIEENISLLEKGISLKRFAEIEEQLKIDGKTDVYNQYGFYVIYNKTKGVYTIDGGNLGTGFPMSTRINQFFLTNNGRGNPYMHQHYKAGDEMILKFYRYRPEKHGSMVNLENEIRKEYERIADTYVDYMLRATGNEKEIRNKKGFRASLDFFKRNPIVLMRKLIPFIMLVVAIVSAYRSYTTFNIADYDTSKLVTGMLDIYFGCLKFEILCVLFQIVFLVREDFKHIILIGIPILFLGELLEAFTKTEPANFLIAYSVIGCFVFAKIRGKRVNKFCDSMIWTIPMVFLVLPIVLVMFFNEDWVKLFGGGIIVVIIGVIFFMFTHEGKRLSNTSNVSTTKSVIPKENNVESNYKNNSYRSETMKKDENKKVTPYGGKNPIDTYSAPFWRDKGGLGIGQPQNDCIYVNAP